MSDFFQNGEIATFHRLRHREIEKIEAELELATRHRPVSLVLPYIPIELKGPGLPKIVEELRNVKYLKNIIVTVGMANANDFKEAKEFFSVLPQKPKLIWCTGPKIQKLYGLLAENGIDVGEDGKGRSAWTAYGYILALEDSHVIALHDCDISHTTGIFLRDSAIRLPARILILSSARDTTAGLQTRYTVA